MQPSTIEHLTSLLSATDQCCSNALCKALTHSASPSAVKKHPFHEQGIQGMSPIRRHGSFPTSGFDFCTHLQLLRCLHRE